jgi:thioesterase domain-containing protein
LAELVRELRGHGPVYGLHASESEDDVSIEALARDYLAQVRAVQPRGPYLLGGWSFGGLVAYEMTLQLQAAGEPVALLALLTARPSVVEPPGIEPGSPGRQPGALPLSHDPM